MGGCPYFLILKHICACSCSSEGEFGTKPVKFRKYFVLGIPYCEPFSVQDKDLMFQVLRLAALYLQARSLEAFSSSSLRFKEQFVFRWRVEVIYLRAFLLGTLCQGVVS